MMVFFDRKINQKLGLLASLTLIVFLSSCSSQRRAMVKDEKVQKVVATARSYVGTPYLYGGMSRSGMDCSGLLLTSYRAVDISLPRSSHDQSKVGKEIKKGELEPGDLVFFATGRRKRKVTHVGMVTERRGRKGIQFIHASSSSGVVESNMEADYYQKRYRGARRIIR